MTRIGEAWKAYVTQKQLYPAQAITDRSHRRLLSWRVELLPYLGYKELYAEFHLDEPWNSRHNQPLIAKIPAVYQSPERFDTRTNYVVPVSPNTYFALGHQAMETTIEDGPENTVAILEVDDPLAVTWTEPRDFDLKIDAPLAGLGTLRGGSFFLIWSNGEVGRVLTTANDRALRAMYTFDGGESFQSGSIDKPLFPPTQPASSVAAGAAASGGASASAAPAASPHSSQSSVNATLMSLAGEYRENADTEKLLGNEHEAGLWTFAAALVSPPGSGWSDEYQWVPALRRPTPFVRFGVGLQYSGPRASEVNKAASSSSAGRGKPQVWTTVTDKVGDELVQIISAHANPAAGSAPARGRSAVRTARRRASPLDVAPGGPLAPGVYFLAAAREGVLRQAAQREGVDVLVFVDWHEAGNNYSAQVQLIDVLRKETLLELPRIDSAQIEKAKTDPLANNPVAVARDKLADFLTEQLSPEPLPKQIEPRHVVGRLGVLASSKEENPLRGARRDAILP